MTDAATVEGRTKLWDSSVHRSEQAVTLTAPEARGVWQSILDAGVARRRAEDAAFKLTELLDAERKRREDADATVKILRDQMDDVIKLANTIREGL